MFLFKRRENAKEAAATKTTTISEAEALRKAHLSLGVYIANIHNLGIELDAEQAAILAKWERISNLLATHIATLSPGGEAEDPILEEVMSLTPALFEHKSTHEPEAHLAYLFSQAEDQFPVVLAACLKRFFETLKAAEYPTLKTTQARLEILFNAIINTHNETALSRSTDLLHPEIRLLLEDVIEGANQATTALETALGKVETNTAKLTADIERHRGEYTASEHFAWLVERAQQEYQSVSTALNSVRTSVSYLASEGFNILPSTAELDDEESKKPDAIAMLSDALTAISLPTEFDFIMAEQSHQTKPPQTVAAATAEAPAFDGEGEGEGEEAEGKVDIEEEDAEGEADKSVDEAAVSAISLDDILEELEATLGKISPETLEHATALSDYLHHDDTTEEAEEGSIPHPRPIPLDAFVAGRTSVDIRAIGATLLGKPLIQELLRAKFITLEMDSRSVSAASSGIHSTPRIRRTMATVKRTEEEKTSSALRLQQIECDLQWNHIEIPATGTEPASEAPRGLAVIRGLLDPARAELARLNLIQRHHELTLSVAEAEAAVEAINEEMRAQAEAVAEGQRRADELRAELAGVAARRAEIESGGSGARAEKASKDKEVAGAAKAVRTAELEVKSITSRKVRAYYPRMVTHPILFLMKNDGWNWKDHMRAYLQPDGAETRTLETEILRKKRTVIFHFSTYDTAEELHALLQENERQETPKIVIFLPSDDRSLTEFLQQVKRFEAEAEQPFVFSGGLGIMTNMPYRRHLSYGGGEAGKLYRSVYNTKPYYAWDLLFSGDTAEAVICLNLKSLCSISDDRLALRNKHKKALALDKLQTEAQALQEALEPIERALREQEEALVRHQADIEAAEQAKRDSTAAGEAAAERSMGPLERLVNAKMALSEVEDDLRRREIDTEVELEGVIGPQRALVAALEAEAQSIYLIAARQAETAASAHTDAKARLTQLQRWTAALFSLCQLNQLQCIIHMQEAVDLLRQAIEFERSRAPEASEFGTAAAWSESSKLAGIESSHDDYWDAKL